MKQQIIGLAALAFPFVAGCVGADVDEFASMTDEVPEISETSTALSAQPDVNSVYVQDIRASGSGCRTADSVNHVIGADGQSFIIVFNDMQLTYPPGTP